MNENLKEIQRNWIGKSEGMEVNFDIVDSNNDKISSSSIFTTCIETIYGITFFVMAPEHHLIEKLKDKITNYNEVKEYQKKTTYRSELDRISDQKEKTGCKLEGIYAINPINDNKVPIYISDFVLANYGTGIVMAVPTHDQRDYEFAKKFNIPMIQVIDGDVSRQAYEKYDYMKNNDKMLNSDEFNGMHVKEAKEKIIDKVIKLGFGKKQINYKMQDWSFNRQRYWGEPFPIIFCSKCGTIAVSDDKLPLTLPKTDDYMPNDNGSSPLSKIDSWVNCKCPKCGGPAKRETDTMPNWAGSSWYWLRYCDPHNEKALADFEKLKYWGSVDCYTGGTEHITRHVLYAFFWQNFLYEIGVVPTRDPFVRKMGSGLILDDTGRKMSKSSTNGVSPMEVIEQYGTDVARLHVHFLGGYEDNTPWTYDGITGITNFINKVWDLQNIVKGNEISEEHKYEINGLIKKVSEDIENLKLNTSIAAFMTFINVIKKDKFITKEELKIFLILLNPLAPHITSEIYEIVFNDNIINDTWPEYDERYLIRNEINLPIQINGKMKKTILVDLNIEDENKIIEMIKSQYPDLINNEIKKVIYIKNKIINIIL
jgi:leucyl-tRNA synthetase